MVKLICVYKTQIYHAHIKLILARFFFCVYVDGVFELVWKVVPVCTGLYEDHVSSSEVDYGWNVVCNMWYGYMAC